MDFLLHLFRVKLFRLALNLLVVKNSKRDFFASVLEVERDFVPFAMIFIDDRRMFPVRVHILDTHASVALSILLNSEGMFELMRFLDF